MAAFLATRRCQPSPTSLLAACRRCSSAPGPPRRPSPSYPASRPPQIEAPSAAFHVTFGPLGRKYHALDCIIISHNGIICNRTSQGHSSGHRWIVTRHMIGFALQTQESHLSTVTLGFEKPTLMSVESKHDDGRSSNSS